MGTIVEKAPSKIARDIALREFYTDHLATALLITEELREVDRLVMITADKGLFTASQDVGLPVFNPDRHTVAELVDLL